MKEVALSDVKEELSYLHMADYRLESDPRFLRRVAEARGSIRGGEGVALEDASVDEARSLRGIGWEGDLDEMRSGRCAGAA